MNGHEGLADGGTSTLSFLSSLAGERVFGDLHSWLLLYPRLKKYLFYEMIASSDLVRHYRSDPEFREDLEKAILWYGNYRSLFERARKINSELDILCKERGIPPLGWKGWNANRTVFMKGLSWQRII